MIEKTILVKISLKNRILIRFKLQGCPDNPIKWFAIA